MKTKTVFINMSIYNLPRSASTLYRPSVPEILIKVRELDDIISCIPNVEVNLEIFVRFELMDDEEQLEYEQTKTMLAGLLADTTALKLKVTCSRALVDACPQWDIFVSP
ncbi:hypothetical protein ONZ45_g4531 [Pleurotus djamor]|nr:hypothetical protein ONZ45_g4531 [Pleurotus djamor]